MLDDSHDIRDLDNPLNFILTYLGEKFSLYDPDWKTIHIEDIAHSLANECRYGGHTDPHYSVGDHSLRVAHRCRELAKERGLDPDFAYLHGLVHDFHEAYTKDIPSPNSKWMYFHWPDGTIESMKALKNRIQDVILLALGLPHPPAAYELLVAHMDRAILPDEGRDLMFGNAAGWNGVHGPTTDEIIIPREPLETKEMLLFNYKLAVDLLQRRQLDVG